MLYPRACLGKINNQKSEFLNKNIPTKMHNKITYLKGMGQEHYSSELYFSSCLTFLLLPLSKIRSER